MIIRNIHVGNSRLNISNLIIKLYVFLYLFIHVWVISI